jgi:dolichyl-phosphate beta-glucosyltransferase
MTADPADLWVVVPCYNEARRLDRSAFRRLLASTDAPNLLLVDDGSTDDTVAVLETIAAVDPRRCSVQRQPANTGKG